MDLPLSENLKVNSAATVEERSIGGQSRDRRAVVKTSLVMEPAMYFTV